jgi:hypothetical protein
MLIFHLARAVNERLSSNDRETFYHLLNAIIIGRHVTHDSRSSLLHLSLTDFTSVYHPVKRH